MRFCNYNTCKRALPSELVAISRLLAFAFGCLDSNLLIIFLQCCQVLTCLREFAFFHSLTNVPMHKGALAVHKVKLVVDAREDLSNGRGVADHARGTHDL